MTTQRVTPKRPVIDDGEPLGVNPRELGGMLRSGIPSHQPKSMGLRML